MRTVMVRYKIKADKAAENEAYVQRVFEQLHREKPDGVHYAVFKQEDGVSFVHLAQYEEAQRSALVDTAAFKEYVAGVEDRCEEPPVQIVLQAVGTYNVFGEIAALAGKA